MSPDESSLARYISLKSISTKFFPGLTCLLSPVKIHKKWIIQLPYLPAIKSFKRPRKKEKMVWIDFFHSKNRDILKFRREKFFIEVKRNYETMYRSSKKDLIIKSLIS